MASAVINTRNDLDAIIGTADHDVFMSMLGGTLYRVEKDDIAGAWLAIEDNSTIERFGFTRADFPGATPPELPVYVPPDPEEPEYRLLRAAAYPSVGDQLDALFHAGVFPAEMAALLQAVKDQYPK